MEVLDVLGPKRQKNMVINNLTLINLCRSHRTCRSRCCRLVLPAPHPQPVHPSPSARPHDPKPVSDPACARDQLARTHPASPRRVVVARSWSPAPARELRTRRCRPELIRIPPLRGVGAGAPQRRRRGRRGRRPGGHAARREVCPHPQVMASTSRSKYTKHHLCVHPTSARSTITLPLIHKPRRNRNSTCLPLVRLESSRDLPGWACPRSDLDRPPFS